MYLVDFDPNHVAAKSHTRKLLAKYKVIPMCGSSQDYSLSKEEIIEIIMKNEKNGFTEDVLKKLSISEKMENANTYQYTTINWEYRK